MDESEKNRIKNLINFGDSPDKPEDKPEIPEITDETQKIPEIPETKSNPESEKEYNGSGETQIIRLVSSGNGDTDVSDSDGDADKDDYDGEDDAGDASGADGGNTDADNKDVTEAPDDEYTEDNPDLPDVTAEENVNYDFGYGFDDDNKGKKSKTGKIIKYSVIAAVLAAAIVMFAVTDTGIIGAYKRNFAHNFSKIFGLNENKPRAVQETDETVSVPDAVIGADGGGEAQTGEIVYADTEDAAGGEISNMEIKSSVIIPYEYVTDSDFGAYSNGVVCAATNYMCYINNSGEKEWECATSVIDPILETAGDYILIAQEGGTKLCLYEKGKLVYDIDCEDNILNADLSENGDCVLVTTKDLYKGALAAYNKNGQLIYARSSGGGSVIDAAISPKSRNIAVALLNTDDMIRSTVEIFDITKNDPAAAVNFDDTILFDVEYFGDTVNAFGDNSILGLRSNGRMLFDMRFDGADINHYAYDKSGNKLLMLDYGNVPTLMLYGGRGNLRSTLTSLEMADFLEIKDGRIMYNADRDIITGKLNGKSMLRYTASMDIHDIIMVDKNSFFIVYSNSLELVRM